jgi:hypothetical protein
MSTHGKNPSGCGSAAFLIMGTILGLIILAIAAHGGK